VDAEPEVVDDDDEKAWFHCGSVSLLFQTGVELESPGVWVLARSRSLSFEGDSDSGPSLFHLDFCVILLQSI